MSKCEIQMHSLGMKGPCYLNHSYITLQLRLTRVPTRAYYNQKEKRKKEQMEAFPKYKNTTLGNRVLKQSTFFTNY